MKKILALIMVMILMFIPVAADEEIGDVFNDVYGESDVFCHVYSSYYVTIPTELTPEHPEGEITISMNNIEEGYHVDLYATNLNGSMVDLSSDNGNTYSVNAFKYGNVSFDDTGLIASFYPDYYDDNNPLAYAYVSVSGFPEKIKPGDYKGSISFRVSCVKDE